MPFPIDTIFLVLALVWYTCVKLVTATVCCVFAWVVLKSALVIYAAIGRPATSHARPTPRRGKKNNVERSAITSPFHPNAPAHPQGMLRLELMLRFLDQTLDRLATFGPTLFGMVSMSDILQRLTYINDVRGPLNSRLNRGIAQILTLRDQVVAYKTIIFRYLVPTTFLCCLLIGLGAIVNVSIVTIMLVCSGAMVVVVTDQSYFAPARVRAGLLSTLLERAGAL